MLILHVKYKMKPGMAKRFVVEIEGSGIGAAIRAEQGNIMYEYFYPATGAEEVLLVERWEDEDALAAHMKQPHMAELAEIKAKYADGTVIEKYKVL